MPVYFADPTMQRQGVVAGFVLSAPDYAGEPEQPGGAIYWSFANSNITVGGQTVKIGYGYQHWVNIGGVTFSYVQNTYDSPSTIATALANLINGAADALATASTYGGQLSLVARQNTGAAIAVTASTSASPYNTQQTLFELTGNELVPAITTGVLFAQGTMYRPALAPTLPAPAANQQSWLFYNSGTGWYWKASATPNTSDDACVGWVVTSATAVIAFSSRQIGTGDEAPILQPAPAAIAMGGEGDTDVPPAPTFDAAETDTQLLLGDIEFLTAVNTAGIDFAMFALFSVDETAGTGLTLSAGITAGATGLNAAGGALPASSPGSVSFTFYASGTYGGLTIGPGYVHSIEIGPETYTYAQQVGDAAADVATALANIVNAYADPNAMAAAVGSTVVLKAAQNTNALVTCVASDGNTSQTLVETLPTYVVIDQEIIQVNASNGSSIVRAQKGSTAASHTTGAKIWPVITRTIVFALPVLSYGTPAWPSIVGQIPFAGQALVAADCWVTNEIGPSPVTTNCYTGQGPYAVDANGIPLAPDVAAFTAGATTGIQIGGQPYYEFYGTIKTALALGTTAEIDVVMTDGNGADRTVYKFLGPFAANATVSWTSIPYPQPTTGGGLTFTPKVVPLNPDLAPTVSAHTPAAINIGKGSVGTTPNVTGSCQAVQLAGNKFGLTGQIILPVTDPNYAALQAGSIGVEAGPAGGTMSTALVETSWGLATTLNFTAGTPGSNSFDTPSVLTNWTVQFQCEDGSGSPTPNPFTITLAVAPGPATPPAAASAAIAYSLDGNVSTFDFNGALTAPASLVNLSRIQLQLQITIGGSTVTTPFVNFSQTDLNFVGANGVLNYGPAYGNTPGPLSQPQTGPDWTVAVQYVGYNAAGVASAAVTISTFTVYVSKLTALTGVEGARSAPTNGSTLTQFTLTPTVYHAGIYPTGGGLPGNGALTVTVWHSQDGGTTWVFKGVFTLPTATSTINIAQLWVPTNGAQTWQFAAAAGWYNAPVGSGTIPAASLPAAAVMTATLSVASCGTCSPADVTNIRFVNWPSTSSAILSFITDQGRNAWMWYQLQMTLPTAVADPAFFMAAWYVDQGHYDSGTGAWTSLHGEQLIGQQGLDNTVVAGQSITITFPNGSAAPSGYPEASSIDRIFKIRVRAFSRLVGDTGTLESGWAAQGGNTSSGSSWDLTLPVQQPTLDLSQALPASLGQGLVNTGAKIAKDTTDSSNLAPNPDFEYPNVVGNLSSGPLSWLVAGLTAILQSAVVKSGSYACQVTRTGAPYLLYYGSSGAIINVNPGDQFTFAIYIRAAAGASGTVTCYLNFFDSAWTQNSQGGTASVSYAAANGQWVLAFSGIVAAPSWATQMRIVGIDLSAATGTWYVDSVKVDRNPLAVDGGTLVSASVTGGALANATVTGTQIANATIAAANIANATITATQIANATVTATQIANATITGTQIGAATVAGSNVAAATIAGSNVAASTIAGSNIAGGTVTASNITSLTITAAQIANLTINGTQISSGAIGGADGNGKLAAGTITGGSGGDLESASIAGLNIASATIAGTNIANGTIAGSNIANATIVGTNLASATVTATQIASLTITASQIANLTITGAQIYEISADKISAGTISASLSITSASYINCSGNMATSADVLCAELVILPLSPATTLAYTGLTIGGNQVVAGRQTGPGTPSFSSVADAQTWCAGLNTALKAHGLIT